MTNTLYEATKEGFGGEIKVFDWIWKSQQIKVVYEVFGNGQPLLLLPAFSTVSMRTEMKEIGKLLAGYFQVVALDWPGFGDSSRISVDYEPSLYQHFLDNFVTSIFNSPVTVIGAGHSAAYILGLASKNNSAFSRIVLVAPTWRGPLPTMGANQQIAGVVRGLVRSPIIGQFLYKLNTTPSFLSLMYRRHVYVDAAKLTPEFVQYKWHNTQQKGARFAPAAFVTGNLDAVMNREDFLALVQGLPVPLMVVIGESCPPSSRAEMDALAKLPGVESVILPGSLGMHEEYPQAVVEAISSFLNNSR